MKSLGLSPTEQEVVDMQCEVEKKGRIFFPDFCKLCLRKFREFDEENFKQELFKNLCGTEPHPVRFRAKKYKIQEKSFSLADFKLMMNHLPEPVAEQEILEMFNYADKDRDGRINFEEFLVMITPVKVPEVPTIQSKQQNNNNINNKRDNVNTCKKQPGSLTNKLGMTEAEKADLEEGTKTADITSKVKADRDNHSEDILINTETNNKQSIENNTVENNNSNQFATTLVPAITNITTTSSTNITTTSSTNIPVATLVTTA